MCIYTRGVFAVYVGGMSVLLSPSALSQHDLNKKVTEIDIRGVALLKRTIIC